MGTHQVRATPPALSPARLKIALLCEGVDFSLDMFEAVHADFYANQYVYGRTSRGALRSHRLPQALNLGDGVVCALLRREGSPWTLQLEGERVVVCHEGRRFAEADLPQQPPYFGRELSDGQRSENFIAVAGEATPGFFLYPQCHYFPDGVPCSFCSLSHSRRTAGREMASNFNLEIVAEATRLFQRTPWKEIPIISITTGTFPDCDEGARYTASVVRALYDALDPKVPIHVLTMPPTDHALIEIYRDAGATSVAFNVEVFDREAFRSMCPGKERFYGYDNLLNALERAAVVFGPYNAFCGFVWGLEPFESVVRGYRWCSERGISVSSNVFHADQGAVFAQRAHPSTDEILRLCEAQAAIYKEFPGARTIFPMSMRSTLDWEIHRGDLS